MDIIILAGGKGSRLQKYFPGIPKILIEVKGKTLLERQIDNLSKWGFDRIILSLGYLSDKVIFYLIKKNLDKRIEYYVESFFRGTGGSIPAIYEKFILKDPFFIINGDTLLNIDYSKILDYHRAKNSDITIVIKKENKLEDVGSVIVDNNYSIKDFKEKNNSGVEGNYINAGCYCVNYENVAEIFDKDTLSMEYDVLPRAIKEGKKVYGYEITSGFYDFGTIEKINKYSSMLD